jgi:hypothetical protein
MSPIFALVLAVAPLQEALQPLKLESLNLTVAPPPLEEVTFDARLRGQVNGSWKGKLAGFRVEASVFVLPISQFGFVEPEDVTEILLDNLRDEKKLGGDANFGWDSQELRPGKYGWTPYASLAIGTRKVGTEAKSRVIMFSSLTKDAGYVVEIHVEPEPDAAATKTIIDWLAKGVVYGGEARNWKWSDTDAKARWEKDAPKGTHKKFDGAIRTDHYLILTNSSGGKAFAKKMEECYAAIRKVYPFDDVAGRLLMPVFLFRTPDEYYAFCQQVANMSISQAEATKGHAWKDYYATWYEAPNDPVHIHEATHQIFSNRLRLSGGGSWFQEGVAEYISSSANDRNMAASMVRKERQTPLAEFMTTESLIASGSKDDVSGDDAASNAYAQAALLIEFLRESKWGKDKFQTFVHTVGLVPRGKLPAIEAAIRKVYGCDIDTLEAKWVEYCKKR